MYKHNFLDSLWCFDHSIRSQARVTAWSAFMCTSWKSPRGRWGGWLGGAEGWAWLCPVHRMDAWPFRWQSGASPDQGEYKDRKPDPGISTYTARTFLGVGDLRTLTVNKYMWYIMNNTKMKRKCNISNSILTLPLRDDCTDLYFSSSGL